MEDLIRRAREGDRAAFERLLAQVRPQLKAIAERSLDQRLKRRVDASDVVQQTLLDVTRAIDQLANTTDQGLLAWLRTSVQRDAEDLVRKHIAARLRSVYGETSLDASAGDAGPLHARLDSDYSTPSHVAMRNEEEAALHAALDQLPSEQATAIRMRHFQNMGIKDIAQQMDRSPAAVSQLLLRGMRTLRERLKRKIQ